MQQHRRRGGLTLRLLALGVLALTASPAQADTANGPYYAVPSWDQKIPVATRYTVLLNWNSEAVLDRETGLVWERAPETQVPRQWFNAASACLAKNVGKRKGWRLPSVAELMSLINPSESVPPNIHVGHPFQIHSGVHSYWSATSVETAGGFAMAWIVIFSEGGRTQPQNKSFEGDSWCVHGGSHGHAY